MSSGRDIYWAVHEGQIDILIKYLKKSATNVNYRTEDTWTPLMLASDLGFYDIAAVLLDYGALVNDRRRDESSSLHYASERGHTSLVRLLLDHGADIEVKNWACRRPLHCAVAGGHKETVLLLLERECDVDAVLDDTQDTALHLAAANDDKDMCELLTGCGANLHLRNNADLTAEENASRCGFRGMAEFLRSLRPPVPRKDDNTGWDVFPGSYRAPTPFKEKWAASTAFLKRGEIPPHNNAY